MAARPFVHLDVRSCFSLKEGAFTPEQLVARAAELGMPAVALTDRDGLYGAARFVAACATEGVRPILGASLTVRAPAPPPGDAHVVLLAEDDAGLREPLPAAHRRAPAGRARRPLGRDRADLRARGRADRRCSARGRTPGGSRSPAASTPPRTLAAAVPRGVRSRAVRRRRRASGRGAAPTSEVRAMLRFAERLDATRGRHEPGALPGARRRVRRRRAGVHAPDRADRVDQRHPHERRGLAEAAASDARAVRRAAGPLRRARSRSPSVHVRPRAQAGALPGLPDAGGAQRRRAARRAVLARGARARHARGRTRCATACTSSSR